MKKIIVALTIAAAFLLAPVGDPYESAQQKVGVKIATLPSVKKEKLRKQPKYLLVFLPEST